MTDQQPWLKHYRSLPGNHYYHLLQLTFLEKVARQIFVNGVEVASATSTSNLTYSLTISSNTTATIRFVATNIYDGTDVYDTTNYLNVDGILQGTGSILYNGQPITNSNGRVPAYSSMEHYQ